MSNGAMVDRWDPCSKYKLGCRWDTLDPKKFEECDRKVRLTRKLKPFDESEDPSDISSVFKHTGESYAVIHWATCEGYT